MIEMRKLQKLGKVELLELVRELTEELEEVRFKNDVLLKAGREEKPPGQGEAERAFGTGVLDPTPPQPPAPPPPPEPVWGSSPQETWQRLEPSGGPPGASPVSPPPQVVSPPPREPHQGMLEELEGFRRSIREICEIAERTRQEMDGCMTRVELAIKHREEEARQMAEQAYGKSEDVLRTLQEYKRQTEETLSKMMETVTSLQRVIQ